MGCFAVLVVLLTSLMAMPSPRAGAAEDDCVATRMGDDVVLQLSDNGQRRVIRRNDTWLATLGTDVSSYIDEGAPAGASYIVRSRTGDAITDSACTLPDNPVDRCTITRVGDRVTVEWIDDGGSHVLRRNGDWLTTPGPGTDQYVDDPAPQDSTYELRTRESDELTETSCVEADDNPAPAVTERVLHVSIDGLRVDSITPELMPNLTRLVTEGSSTMNARTDPRVTRTLPNHTSQLTGLPVKVHGVDYNEDLGRTVHAEAGRYVPSVFDVVHDHGGRTAAFVGKEKFDVHDRSWDEANGAIDEVGPDDGRDKIDRFERAIPEETADMLIGELDESDDLEFAFFHIRYPDRAGHDFGWSSAEYQNAVAVSDGILGRILDAIEKKIQSSGRRQP